MLSWYNALPERKCTTESAEPHRAAWTGILQNQIAFSFPAFFYSLCMALLTGYASCRNVRKMSIIPCHSGFEHYSGICNMKVAHLFPFWGGVQLSRMNRVQQVTSKLNLNQNGWKVPQKGLFFTHLGRIRQKQFPVASCRQVKYTNMGCSAHIAGLSLDRAVL